MPAAGGGCEGEERELDTIRYRREAVAMAGVLCCWHGGAKDRQTTTDRPPTATDPRGIKTMNNLHRYEQQIVL